MADGKWSKYEVRRTKVQAKLWLSPADKARLAAEAKKAGLDLGQLVMAMLVVWEALPAGERERVAATALDEDGKESEAR